MIAVPAGVRVWLATGHTDMRKGFDGLALFVQETLKRDPHCGHLFASVVAGAISSSAFGAMVRACVCSPNGSNGTVPVAVDGRRNGDDLDCATRLSSGRHRLASLLWNRAASHTPRTTAMN